MRAVLGIITVHSSGTRAVGFTGEVLWRNSTLGLGRAVLRIITIHSSGTRAVRFTGGVLWENSTLGLGRAVPRAVFCRDWWGDTSTIISPLMSFLIIRQLRSLIHFHVGFWVAGVWENVSIAGLKDMVERRGEDYYLCI